MWDATVLRDIRTHRNEPGQVSKEAIWKHKSSRDTYDEPGEQQPAQRPSMSLCEPLQQQTKQGLSTNLCEPDERQPEHRLSTNLCEPEQQQSEQRISVNL